MASANVPASIALGSPGRHGAHAEPCPARAVACLLPSDHPLSLPGWCDLTTQAITVLWRSVVDSYQHGLTWEVLTPHPPGSPPRKVAGYLPWQRHCKPPPPRPWLVTGSHGLGTDEAGEVEEDRRCVGCQPQNPLSRWENGHVTPDYYQGLLCEVLKATPGELGFGIQDLPSGPAGQSTSGTALIAKREDKRRQPKQPFVVL